jgi:serine/threonine protein kinase/Tfp pilus assembly protein PilF
MPVITRDSDVESLVARLADDMAQRWRQGERPLAEEYLARHPELADLPHEAVELIYEEVCLRHEHHEPVIEAEILGRFPQWQAQLSVLLDCHQLMQAGVALPEFPNVGETLGDFHLRAELGRGAAGRVFLATESSLADRPVVFKVGPLLGREHLSLARLQHTHIVPLYFVQDFPDRLLRALCMPYFGGASLAALLEAMREIPVHERTGGHLVEALRQAQAAAPIAIAVRGPSCRFLGSASYEDAVCWIGAHLADALQYAHERGLLHLDLKPANVLLAADGQPMLLDFHLAREPVVPGARPPDWLGGSPAYMAPEQRAACHAVREGETVTTGLDARADLFALGVLLYEMLGGAIPVPATAAGHELRRRNPTVSAAIADLLEKCLAAEAGSRYADAAALAGDLRRHLGALPLRGVANRSWRERWQKWRRRRPAALAGLMLLAAILGLAGFAGLSTFWNYHESRGDLRLGRELKERDEPEQAQNVLQRGLTRVEGSFFGTALAAELREELSKVESALALLELHKFVDRARSLVGAEVLPAKEARAVEMHCQTLWDRRQRILALRTISPEAQPQLHADFLDLAVLWTDLRVRLAAASDRPQAHREALTVLEQAERLCGGNCVLCRERGRHASALGLTTLAAQLERQAALLSASTAWEHDALGRSLLQQGDVAAAAAQFDQALELRPEDLWANYHKGRCAFLLAKHKEALGKHEEAHRKQEEALTAFSVCIALTPKSGWCYYNRGLAQIELAHPERALRDFDRALRLDPGLAGAALSRGLLHYREKRYDAALADLRRALDGGAHPAAVHHGLALVYLARGDRPTALSELHEALRHEPNAKDARNLLEQLQRQN